jgi:hypothetical protein
MAMSFNLLALTRNYSNKTISSARTKTWELAIES